MLVLKAVSASGRMGVSAKHLIWVSRRHADTPTRRYEAFLFLMLAVPLRAATVDIYPGTNIQSVVDAHAPGTTYMIHAGLYRLARISPNSGDTYQGEPGTILSGARLLTNFDRQTVNGVTYWVASGPSAPGPGYKTGTCQTTHPLCTYIEDLYFDSVPLIRVSSLAAVVPGKCYFDYAASKIYFLNDPTGHLVEESDQTWTEGTPAEAFTEKNSGGVIATNVTIQGLVIEKYATAAAPQGAIGGQYPGSGWVVKNNEVRWSHASGINIGSGWVVAENYLHHNGLNGITSNSLACVGARVENNEIAFNDTAGYNPAFAAGGAKFLVAKDLTVRGNYFHDNKGPGLWTDGAALGGVYENNRVINNQQYGIIHEIGHQWIIRNNIVTGNGFGDDGLGNINGKFIPGSGIAINQSDHVEVYGNVVMNNYKGIILGMSRREEIKGYTPDLNNNYVHDNVVAMSGIKTRTGIEVSRSTAIPNPTAYATMKNNRFANNAYCLSSLTGTFYGWPYVADVIYPITKTQWQAKGQDVGGNWSCPAVKIIEPASGGTVSGTVPVTAYAAADNALTKMELYVDGALKATVSSSNNPYIFSWNSTQAANGSHTLMTRAYDAAGNSADAAVTVMVNGSVSSPCDANKDGATNIVDVQLVVNMALGASCTADINNDGVCNVIDVQRVTNAALGGLCVSS